MYTAILPIIIFKNQRQPKYLSYSITTLFYEAIKKNQATTSKSTKKISNVTIGKVFFF